ncbi:hypothetical protein [Mesorhizobium erdmanii]|uniref:hypothetical protein n=1 Tax=Mesorhizobium erdmanii TaxID=1777866 RepID=UPI0012B621EB|nr:hypothetical protein [Mesorhizobium erdmanii]
MSALGQASIPADAGDARGPETSSGVVQRWSAGSVLAMLVIAAAALVLRLLGARGDLWLDEIWTFALLEPLTSIDQIFWRINHDNNHFLNSAYLYLIGPDASSLLQRGLSVALGVGAVLAAGLLAASRGWRTAIVTSVLFATSYPMVHYGSEARGYAGLVLFTLLSVLFLERRLDNRGSAIGFAAIVLVGFLSHLTMAETVVILVAWASWLAWSRTGSLASANLEVGLIFAPAFLAVLPLAACVLLGSQVYGFQFGGVSSFSLQTFAQGYGGMIRYLFGLPSLMSDWICIGTACGLVLVSACLWRDRRTSLYVIGTVGLPLLMAAAHLPNVGFPRYFLVSGTLLLLVVGELLGRGFQAGGRGFLVSAAALAAMLVGNTSSLLQFYEHGRGSYSRMVGQMTPNGDTTYASGHDLRTGIVVDYFAGRLGRQASLVPADKMCSQPPDWLILEGGAHEQFQYVQPSSSCVLAFERTDAATAWGFSGIDWTLYRRRD